MDHPSSSLQVAQTTSLASNELRKSFKSNVSLPHRGIPRNNQVADGRLNNYLLNKPILLNPHPSMSFMPHFMHLLLQSPLHKFPLKAWFSI